MHPPMIRLLVIPFFLLGFSLPAQDLSLTGSSATYAVVVGISEYQDPEISDLQFADRDAQAFVQYLRSPAGGNVPAEHIRLLLNDKATTGQIVNALGWLTDVVGEDETAIIYFSGHGDVETQTAMNLGFFLTYDSPSHSYMAGAYALLYLQSVVTTISQQNKARVIVISDACRAGQLAGMSIGGPQVTANMLRQQFANEVKILACGPDEYSNEGVQWGNGRGAFSFHLIRGLQGLADTDGNYEVNLREIDLYLSEIVPRETAPSEQYPMVVGSRSTTLSLVDPASLQQLEKGKEQEAPFVLAAVVTKNLEEAVLSAVDTSIQEWYAAFARALEEGRLLEPESESAYHYYQLLKDQEEMKPLRGAMARNLAAALQDGAQQAINQYLQSDPSELARRAKNDPLYGKYPLYLARSAELLGRQHYLYNNLKAKELYFEGVQKRLEGERADDPGLFQEALNHLTEAITFDPTGAYLYNELGLVYGCMGDSEREIRYYEKALEFAPNWAMPTNNLAAAYCETGNAELAMQYARRAVELRPDLDHAHNQLAKAYELSGDLAKAAEEYQKAIDLYSEDPVTRYNLANIQYQQGKYKLAISQIEEIVKMAPDYDNSNGFYLLGLAHQQLGENKKAEKAYLRSIEIEPESFYAHYALGQIYERQKNEEGAVASFKKAFELNPAYPNPAYKVARIQASKGNAEEALSWLKKAIDAGYNHRDELLADEAFQALRDLPAFQELIKEQ